MIVLLIGICLGLAALMLRSLTAFAGVGLAMVAVYVASAMVSLNGVSMILLLTAVAGYNLGISAGFIGMMTLQKLKANWHGFTSESTNS